MAALRYILLAAAITLTLTLLAFDFMHLTQTRIATIDSFATFFILLMYLFLYRYFTEGRLRHLAACGVTFGIGAATKWTCLYAGAGLGAALDLFRCTGAPGR